MARNRYFNQYTAVAQEQNVVEDLIIEAIKIYGIQAYYLPRTQVNFDRLLGEDASAKFEDALEMELYVKSYDGFQGQEEFLSKFGLQIDEQISFTTSQKRFSQALTPSLLTEYGYNYLNEDGDQLLDDGQGYDYTGIIRPREGDLVWIPLMGFMYEIKFVQNTENFYQLGRLYTYELRCERFEYESQQINTDVAAIDAIEDDYTQDLLGFEYTLEDESGVILDEDAGSLIQEEYVNETTSGADNSFIQQEVDDENVLDFSELNPFAGSREY